MEPPARQKDGGRKTDNRANALGGIIRGFGDGGGEGPAGAGMRPAEASAGRVKESYWPEQVEATIFTVSTLRVGELAADAVGFCSLIDGCCTVPVISTLCPT